MKQLLTLLFLSLAVSCSTVGPPGRSAASELHALLEEAWEYRMEQFPTQASLLGDRRYNDRWTDLRMPAIEWRHERDRDFLARLQSVSLEALNEADRLNHRLFQRELEDRIEGHRFRGYLLAVHQRDGIQTASQLSDALPFVGVKDYEDWIARLKAFPAYMDQTIALMRDGIAANMLHPRVIMERVPGQVRDQLTEDPTRSPFFAPFRHFPDAVPPASREKLAVAAREAITERVFPAFAALLDFLEREYIPACYEQSGCWQQDEGTARYEFLTRSFTTTDLTPHQIHETGLAEVRRIRQEMDRIMDQVGFEGDFQSFLKFLRSDPRFYYQDPADLLTAYRSFAKSVDPALVKIFRRLPRIPYGVEPIPDSIAPDTTTAYYRSPAADGSRAGTYFVNLYRPEVRPKYEIEALTIHEAVPGHHLQIALAMELEGLPSFRRYGGYTAFVEGWALYAESLGKEMGFYQDPYSRFGQFTYEMWRAVRLVVDTGIHYFRWTRPEAIDFFAENAAKTEHDIVNEIDRYIAWPGQALAYKIGELRIKDLRRRAEQELGSDFDIRSFHEAVLENGAVPLDVLEERISSWIDAEKSPTTKPVR